MVLKSIQWFWNLFNEFEIYSISLKLFNEFDIYSMNLIFIQWVSILISDVKKSYQKFLILITDFKIWSMKSYKRNWILMSKFKQNLRIKFENSI